MMIQGSSAFALAVLPIAAALTALFILLLSPLLQRYAMVRPNARSSHREPTPQGGGIAVIGATVIATVAGVGLLGNPGSAREVFIALAATVFIAVVGGIDDLRPLPVVPRLVLQAIAVTLLVAA